MAYAATIGFFDGVHRGHRYVLEQLCSLARQEQLEPLVVSFGQHPISVLQPDKVLQLLTTKTERVQKLKEIVPQVELFDFEKIHHLTAAGFMQMLHTYHKVDVLLMGYDHHFGSDGLRRTEDYEQAAATAGVRVVPATELQHSTHISSTEIRRFVKAGNIEKANELLGYEYELSGTVVYGRQIGRTIGFPTANLQTASEKLIPASGVYAAIATVGSNEYKSLLNIGTNPTVEGATQTIETHLVGFSGELYGQTIRLNIIRRIRDEIKFDSLNDLQTQIEKDKENIQ